MFLERERALGEGNSHTVFVGGKAIGHGRFRAIEEDDEGWIKVGGRRRGSAFKKTAVSDSSRGSQGRQTGGDSSGVDDTGSLPMKSDTTMEEVYNERVSMGSREVSKDANRSCMVGSTVNRCSDQERSSSLGAKVVPGDISRKSGSIVTAEDINRSLLPDSVTASAQMKREREGGKASRESNIFRSRAWESKENQRKIGSLRKVYTIFVDDLPSMIDTWWLRREFKVFGAIVDAFIPRKSRAVTKSKFGFVRFRYRCEAERAIHMMNGIRRQGAILKVKMAQYGREIGTKFNDKLIWIPKKTFSIEMENHRDAVKMGRSYRDVVTGRGLTGSIGDVTEEGSILAVKELASRVAGLELEVARLRQALIPARSEGRWMKTHGASNTSIEGKQMDDEIGGEGRFESTVTDEQQKEEEIGGEGRKVSISGEDFSDLGEIVNGRDIGDNLRSKSVKESEIASEFSGVGVPDFEENMNGGERGDELRTILEKSPEIVSVDDGSVCESVGVTPESLDQGGSCGSFSGEKWPAEFGEGRVTGGFDIFNATGVWGAKLGNHDAGTIDFAKGFFVDSEDEDALEELEVYRQYVDFSEVRKQKECSFSGMDKKSVSVEMEGDRKSCPSANIRKRTKGQKKKEVETKKKRNYESSRWMGVKQRYEHVWV